MKLSFRSRATSALALCSAASILLTAHQTVLADTRAPNAPRAEAGTTAADTAEANRPNVLFILIDDLRPDIGTYGHPSAYTPNIDALGKSGLVFENAFVSQAVCGPSRAALMTGLRPDTTGIIDLNTPVDTAVPDHATILDTFKRAGYQTLGYGKIYHHTDDDADGWTKREEDWEKIQGRLDRKAGIPRVADAQADSRADLPDTKNVELALGDLRTLGKNGKPFFMAVGIHRPHLPFVSPKEDWARYTKGTVPPPINPDGQKGAPPWALVSYEVWNYPDTKAFQPNMPADKTAELRHAYLAAVSYADSLVGDLLGELKKQGLDDNTIVVLWSDHGWKLGDHKAWAKHSTADIDIRVPLIIRSPGVTKANSRTKAIAETVDIYPTITQLAGLQAPSNLAGISLRPILEKPSSPGKAAAFAQYPRNGAQGMGRLMGYTVRTQRFRYTGWVSERDGSVVATELYDLASDPNESTNVADEKRYAADVETLEAMRAAQVAATPKAPRPKSQAAGNGGNKGKRDGERMRNGNKKLQKSDLYD